MDVQFVNLTESDILIADTENCPAVNLPRIQNKTAPHVSFEYECTNIRKCSNIRAYKQTISVHNLPKPKKGVCYIVEQDVADFARNRKDLFVAVGKKSDNQGNSWFEGIAFVQH